MTHNKIAFTTIQFQRQYLIISTPFLKDHFKCIQDIHIIMFNMLAYTLILSSTFNYYLSKMQYNYSTF